MSCANTEALRRAGITRDTVAPVADLTIEKDANGDPTGVIVEREMQPIAELIWFRQASAFTHADRLRALPLSARAYHALRHHQRVRGPRRREPSSCASTSRPIARAR